MALHFPVALVFQCFIKLDFEIFNACLLYVSTLAKSAFFFVSFDLFRRMFYFCFRTTTISLIRTEKNTNFSVYFFLVHCSVWIARTLSLSDYVFCCFACAIVAHMHMHLLSHYDRKGNLNIYSKFKHANTHIHEWIQTWKLFKWTSIMSLEYNLKVFNWMNYLWYLRLTSRFTVFIASLYYLLRVYVIDWKHQVFTCELHLIAK